MIPVRWEGAQLRLFIRHRASFGSDSMTTISAQCFSAVLIHPFVAAMSSADRPFGPGGNFAMNANASSSVLLSARMRSTV